MQASVMLPSVGHAVTSEIAGVVADAEIDVPVVALQIVDAVRIDNAGSKARKIVVQRFNGFLRVSMAVAKKVANEFLLLGIDAEYGITSLFVTGAKPCDVLELAVAVRMVFERAFFEGFASSQTMLVQQLDDDGHTDPELALRQFRCQAPQRQVGPQGARFHRITCRVGTDNLQEGIIETGEQAQTGFSAAPFFRD